MCLIVPLDLDAMPSFGGRPRDTLVVAEDSASLAWEKQPGSASPRLGRLPLLTLSVLARACECVRMRARECGCVRVRV